MLGSSFALNPSLVLAPESALSLLPSRGLSSAPAACSVSAIAVLRNDGTKKEVDFRSAFRHGLMGVVDVFFPGFQKLAEYSQRHVSLDLARESHVDRNGMRKEFQHGLLWALSDLISRVSYGWVGAAAK